MGSNLSRYNDKGLNGRRAQSSGNLCDHKSANVGKIIFPCTKSSKNRYKYCGSLPNHLDGKNSLDNNTSENNNIITDTIIGNLGGTLPHKKKPGTTQLSKDSSKALHFVEQQSEESLNGDPWKYRQDGADSVKYRYAESIHKRHGSDALMGSSNGIYEWQRNASIVLRDKTQQIVDLDVKETLPKPSQDSTQCSALSLGKMGNGPTGASRISIDKIDDKLIFKMLHKPDCELIKHRQYLQQHFQQYELHKDQPNKQEKCFDLKLHKLTVGGEPQDQGYGSERSPEDEHPPTLSAHYSFNITLAESIFRVTLKKGSRGLGLSVSGGGNAGLVCVKRLFPQQPAALSNKLQPGDILLAANGIPLTGLTNYEALEVLRTTSNTVELVICRLSSDVNGTPPTVMPLPTPPPPPTRRDNPELTVKIPTNPLLPLDVEPCGEFDIEMIKIGGSLGFTLRKADSSALGHYIRALVRKPALSDGRIQPGDKIVAVDGTLLSPMSHEEAVALLRQCGPRVKLRLYRDLVQTPISALSPTEPDCLVRSTKTSLRQEAVDMLCDLAVRKLSPSSSSGSICPQQPSTKSCNSPRKLCTPTTRSPIADTEEVASSNDSQNHHSHPSSLNQETSDSDKCFIKTQITNLQSKIPAKDIKGPSPFYDIYNSNSSSCIQNYHHYQHLNRPRFLDLDGPCDRSRFQFSIKSNCTDEVEPIIVTDNLNFDYTNQDCENSLFSNDELNVNLISESLSMPPVLSNDAPFSYKNPAYQSANLACGFTLPIESDISQVKLLHASEQDIPGKIKGANNPGGSKSLLKWKGVMFVPNNTNDINEKCKIPDDRGTIESAVLSNLHEQEHEMFMIELTRGWNSRLGFSLQSEGENTVISVVHPDSVAAKDGRLKQGDILVMVNDESVEHMSTTKIIDLLRKIRGSIGITVLRCKKDERCY